MDIIEIITRVIPSEHKCESCHNWLEKLETYSIDAFAKDDGVLKDTIFFFRNIDLKCSKCGYRIVLSSDLSGEESIRELLKPKYEHTQSGAMLRLALERREIGRQWYV